MTQRRQKMVEISGTCRGNAVEEEYSKLHLESTRKQNKLLDLEIEMKEVALERNKVALQLEKGRSA